MVVATLLVNMVFILSIANYSYYAIKEIVHVLKVPTNAPSLVKKIQVKVFIFLQLMHCPHLLELLPFGFEVDPQVKEFLITCFLLDLFHLIGKVVRQKLFVNIVQEILLPLMVFLEVKLENRSRDDILHKILK